MTTRSDLPRLGASLGVLGTVLEARGTEAWDKMQGWEHGPRKAPSRGEVGGGGGEAEAEARKDEMLQRARAARHFALWRADLRELDRLTQEILRRVDVACPPNPEEVKNRNTGDFEPWTPAEIALAGWCTSCWRHEQTFTPIPTDRKGFKRYKDSCSWCGPIRSQHKIDPPLELVVKHLAGRNISEAEFTAAMEKAKQAAAPKAKGKKGKRGKKQKAAA